MDISFICVEDHFQPIQDFALASHGNFPLSANAIPRKERAKIKPLTELKALEMRGQTGHLFSAAAATFSVALNGYVFRSFDDFRPGKDLAATQRWLKQIDRTAGLQVCVSWDDCTAALVDWDVFCKHWVRFCYPKLTGYQTYRIWPAHQEWFLVFVAERQFLLGLKAYNKKLQGTGFCLGSGSG